MQTGTEPNATATQDSFPANYDPQGQQDSDPGESFKSQKSRHRASVACSTCRERRIRVSRFVRARFRLEPASSAQMLTFVVRRACW